MSKPKSNNQMGLSIAMGAGIGIVFGEPLFGEPGYGLVIGAAVGVAFGLANKAKHNDHNDGQTSKNNNDDQ
ncbi:hypothetical protein E2K93_08225 [Thalassotalea sp. HSM 43]|uniref:hypothetical protein n=1 Tax=Thalassotalea sp. HSM 43 TaxID=2552945 RepID=UPI0010805AB6|nr:hypothetical protein [Thalassotalea sp. HSM 43]QBY04377.1 hypothetical protein E2K93_08225 [Thalassotalea sp. HSM 43]